MTAPASTRQLRAWADQNLAAGFELLVRHPPRGAHAARRRFGAATAFATGRRAAFFNPIVILEPVASADLAAAASWMRELGTPFTLRVRDDVADATLAAAAASLGLVRDPWPDPAMVMAPLRRPPPLPPGLAIEVTTRDTVERFHAANASAFDFPPAALGAVRDLTPADMVADPDVRLFSGFVGGEPVACSIAIRSGDVAGVYAVGTAEPFRRRGFGSAMTWAAVAAGLEWGCRAGTLQASEMGEPVYRAMGFATVARYLTYGEPAAA